MTTAIVDPPVREDGLCAYGLCAKRRKFPESGYATRAVYEADPFCSRVCAEKHFGTYTGRGIQGGKAFEDEDC